MSLTHYIKVWEASDGWRWYELKSSDKVAESGEAYSTKRAALSQAKAHAPEGVDLVIEDADGYNHAA